jgi:glutaminyl-tRNA synthetase
MPHLNPDSLEVVEARVEPALRLAEQTVQFERLGYFCPDAVDHSEDKLVFNRIVTLRDTWAKVEKAALQQQS